MKYKITAFLIVVFTCTACFHSRIITGKKPSTKVIKKAWASSFIYGLVPPSKLKTADKCTNGLARVDTKISFLNGLVGALTFNIYTPLHIKVTCAASSSTAAVDEHNINVLKTKRSSN